ncbi:MAG: RES domain-containing protein [Spirochaetes bacterium]|jgi:RES domain-containing protein|nr:RES domain-containing protein [Spirochaetota bacterium]
MPTQTVWRLTRRTYADDAFSGEGARQYGGRFNSSGTPAVYAAESLALALVETLVGLIDYEDLYEYVFFRVELNASDVDALPPADLPDGWDARPPGAASRQLGDAWLSEKRSMALRVPSVVVPYSFNYVLNPEHPAFREIELAASETLPVDPRLVHLDV